MFAECLDYILETKIGNAIGFLLLAIILYSLFKLTIKIIDYILFKRLMKHVLKAIYGEWYVNEDEEDFNNNVLPNSNQEDEQLQEKNQKKEQIREAERLQNMENDFKTGSSKQQPKQRIVGFNEKAIIGKWTARVAKQALSKYQGLDIAQVNELGYFRALVLAERRARGIDNNFNNSDIGR